MEEHSRKKIFRLLRQYPKGLTIDDIVSILGLKRSTVYQRLNELFHYQLVIEVKTSDQSLFRLAEYDLSVDSSLKERKTRGLEDL